MKRREFVTAPLVTAAMAGLSASAQEAPTYDTILKGGHVIDLANRVNQQMDVAVLGGKIARVDRNIPASAGKATVDVSGYYVTPWFDRSAHLLLLHPARPHSVRHCGSSLFAFRGHHMLRRRNRRRR